MPVKSEMTFPVEPADRTAIAAGDHCLHMAPSVMLAGRVLSEWVVSDVRMSAYERVLLAFCHAMPTEHLPGICRWLPITELVPIGSAVPPQREAGDPDDARNEWAACRQQFTTEVNHALRSGIEVGRAWNNGEHPVMFAARLLAELTTWPFETIRIALAMAGHPSRQLQEALTVARHICDRRPPRPPKPKPEPLLPVRPPTPRPEDAGPLFAAAPAKSAPPSRRAAPAAASSHPKETIQWASFAPTPSTPAPPTTPRSAPTFPLEQGTVALVQGGAPLRMGFQAPLVHIVERRGDQAVVDVLPRTAIPGERMALPADTLVGIGRMDVPDSDTIAAWYRDELPASERSRRPTPKAAQINLVFGLTGTDAWYQPFGPEMNALEKLLQAVPGVNWKPVEQARYDILYLPLFRRLKG